MHELIRGQQQLLTAVHRAPAHRQEPGAPEMDGLHSLLGCLTPSCCSAMLGKAKGRNLPAVVWGGNTVLRL